MQIPLSLVGRRCSKFDVGLCLKCFQLFHTREVTLGGCSCLFIVMVGLCARSVFSVGIKKRKTRCCSFAFKMTGLSCANAL